MTTAEFRAQPLLVAEMRRLLENETLKMWLEALETENPANFNVSSDVTPHFAHVMLGQQTGYGVYKKQFLLGGVGIELQPDDSGPMDYSKSADEIEQEQQRES